MEIFKSGGLLAATFLLFGRTAGNIAGGEVCQVYLRDELASVARPVKELAAFRRVMLEPGESREVSLVLEPERFSMPDASLRRVTEPGTFRVLVGSSSADIRLRGIVTLR